MKYYCIGNKIALVKLMYSDNVLENLPGVGTPIFGKLPITQGKMQSAFEASKEFILCQTIEDAKKLRLANITIGNTNVEPAFFKRAIAQGYPLADHAIYEIEIDNDINIDFTRMTSIPKDQLKKLIAHNLYFKVALLNDRSDLPDIEICAVKKSQIKPKLIACHYFSLENGQEENQEKHNACKIL